MEKFIDCALCIELEGLGLVAMEGVGDKRRWLTIRRRSSIGRRGKMVKLGWELIVSCERSSSILGKIE